MTVADRTGDTGPGIRSSLIRLLRAAARRRVPALSALSATVLVTLFETAAPLLTRDAVDIALGLHAGNTVTRLFPGFSPLTAVVAALCAVAVLRFLFQFIRRFTAGVVSLDTQQRLRVQLLDSLQRLDGPGQDALRTGQVVSRSISDINTVQGILAIFPLTVGNMLKLTLTTMVMLWLSPLLATVALATLPIIVFLGARGRKSLFASTWSAQQKAADLATQVEETVTGVRVVKAFAQEENEITRMESAGRELYAHRMRAARINARFQPALDQLPMLALVVNIAVGGWLALHGSITVGTFVAFSTYLTTLTTVARVLAATMVRLQMGASSIQRVFEVIDLLPSMDTPREGTGSGVPPGPVGIRLDGVSFAEGDRQILSGMSLDVPAGSTVALVGPPGSGKTMLVQLLGRFYAPDSGRILLTGADGDETDFAEVSTAALRDAVICAFDETFLYSATVRENIAVGARGREVDDDAVHAAARVAQAHDFIMDLEHGYDTPVGEKGLTLSGGQRQRIALARALLADPRVLVLDDAASAVDAVTEAAIYRALKQHHPDITVLTIAHRQSTLELADRAALIVDGRVVDEGTLGEMRRSPRFARLMDLSLRDRGARADDRVDSAEDRDGDLEPTDAELWPEVAPEPGLRWNPSPGISRAVPVAGGRGRGVGAVPPSPGLLAQVDALPPATEDPGIDAGAARADSGDFSLRILFRQVRGLTAAVIVLLLVGVATDLAFPSLVRVAIDNGVTGTDSRALWWAAAAGASVVLIAWSAAVLRTVLTARTGERLLFALRLRSYAHLQRLSLSYFESTMSGRIMTRMTTDIDALSSFLQTGLAQSVVAVGTLFGIAGVLLATDVSLTLWAFWAVPVILVATIVFRRISRSLYTRAREQVSAVNADFQESVSGLRTVQMHRTEALRLERFSEKVEAYRRTRIRAQTAVALYFPGIAFISELSQALVLGVGAGMVMEGRITAGVLVAFTMYLGQLFSPIQQLSQIFDGYQQASVGLSRITDLLATETQVPDRGTREGADRAARGPLSVDEVDFSYSGTNGRIVTEGLDLRLEPGTRVAVVGPTGAGKSTLIKLLGRFYDPVSGSVRASGTDIREFPLDDWRHQIGLVPQEPHLFTGTVADNISYGSPGADRSAITAAARRVGALAAISRIPGGFNHLVGERGRGLSSGQRQLIALARAELVEPTLLLLDEATATLDPATETTVLTAAQRVTGGRTSVVVAHRLATAARADRILVLDRGRVVEDGTHAGLIEADTRYRAMWNAHTRVDTGDGGRVPPPPTVGNR
ncbi:ABC transporter ATP-binding protein/permease [Corynebacterium sp. CCM 8835]|uniref:ABC transporter ATP-binding protein n=1 Tax=Corynebacterium antarcticum TaxID=2800405 RepID=A0ABS1FMV9_9CORY|nr:ABC transporter ATP-binding protein [Corynebacterium antarcticum]MCL0246189.1 ABC transporter ATP-binding protein/permease [Corynebacterium antarcticum]MCX7492439.1 ABC transporter ATP-binding protein [Corynebacterium antarcticum]